MDNIVSLYTTSTGRVSRKTWWLGMIGLLVASIVLSIILSVIGLGPWGAMQALDPAAADPAAVSAALAATMRSAAWGSLIIFVLLAYPIYCLSLKRRQDRDNSGFDVKVYLVLMLVLTLVQALGFGMTVTDMGSGVIVPVPAPWLMILSGILGIFGIYLLVVLGFLAGTVGDNSYGADPLLVPETA